MLLFSRFEAQPHSNVIKVKIVCPNATSKNRINESAVDCTGSVLISPSIGTFVWTSGTDDSPSSAMDTFVVFLLFAICASTVFNQLYDFIRSTRALEMELICCELHLLYCRKRDGSCWAPNVIVTSSIVAHRIHLELDAGRRGQSPGNRASAAMSTCTRN